ncbi:MAG: HDIG domain-containing protein [Clostridia bacterium]|nr:HDIG domain-containing protein [Clostridia bacterium]
MKKIKKAVVKSASRGLAIIFASYVVIYLMIRLLIIRDAPLMTRGGFVALIALLFVCLTSFLIWTRSTIIYDIRKCCALAVVLVINMAIMVMFGKDYINLPYLVPYALCALMCANLLDSKITFLVSVNLLIIYFASQLLFVGNASQQLLYYILFDGVFCCVICSYSTNRHFTRARLVLLGVILGITNAIFYALSFALFNGVFVFKTFLTEILLCFGGGLVLIMCLFLFIPLLEALFNLATDFRLVELTRTSAPLLRKLFDEAPGTYNHSMVVAIYAEACATAIGANPFLVKAAAYYHDIGKCKNPQYFIENQGGGPNPHDELTPEASVLAIKKHCILGYSLAKEYNLPEEICRAIIEHHGTMPLKVFYLRAKKMTDGELSYDQFHYDGPTPTTKTSAILMICDACEAALRASGNSSNAEEMVNAVVKERMDLNQFVDCDLSMKEIETIKKTIISTFVGVKHDRIVYPNVKLN